jgi:signal peptidase
VTHRVVRYQPDTEPPSFITKGDANPGEDIDPVPVGAIRGQVWFHVPYVGTAAEVVQGPAGPSLAISLAGLLLMFYVIRRLVAGGRAGSDDAEEPRHVAEAPPLTGAQAS